MIGKPSEESPHHIDEQELSQRQSGPMWSLRYQEEYQSSLGRMLVRFNEVESMVGEILKTALDKLGKSHLFQVNEYFRQKVDKLELASAAFPKWPKVDYERLRRINSWRNEPAHGHFHQDPNTGDWQTRGVHKKGSKSETITPAEIDKWTEEVRVAYGDVGQLLPYVWFDELDEERPLPPGASRTPIE